MLNRSFFRQILTLLLVIPVYVFAQKPNIERIDPPHWWVGFQENEVELLVKGEGFSEDIIVEGDGISLVGAKILPNTHFVKLVLNVEQDAQAQVVYISFKNGKAKRKVKYQFKSQPFK